MLFTYYDTETSGFDSDCDILSFSYMLADENLCVERAETLYFWKEGVTKWTQDAYEVHGLTKEFLRQYEDKYEDNLKKMYIVMSMAELVGWNSGRVNSKNEIVGFDILRCRSFLQRNGLPVPHNPILHDAMLLYSSWRHKRWTKLEEAVKAEGISTAIINAYVSTYFKTAEARAHDSAYDVVCTALLFSRIFAAGYVYNDEVSAPRGGIEEVDDWRLTVGQDKVLHVISDSYGKDYSIADFSVEFPVVYKRIMENPAQYMEG